MTTIGICIPTYKRPDFLRRCVLSVLQDAGERPLHVFIADDSMDDTNTALYAELEVWSERITVHRNATNLGIDDNIQQAIDLCDCDYAWVVGEDDYFIPGSVNRVHELVQGMTTAFIFANYAYVGDNESQNIGVALDVSDGSMDSSDFIAQHLWAVGFIGACIVNRKCWGTSDPKPYVGTYYTHVGRICDLLVRSGDPVHIVAQPCVANRVEGTDTFTWKRDSYGVFFGFLTMCEAVGYKFPLIAEPTRLASISMEKRYGWLTLRLAIRLRSEKGYDIAQYRRHLGPKTSNRIKRLAFYLISVAPPWMFRPLVTGYRWLQRGASE